MINNIIKNKHYAIIKDNKIYAYISVKKDFYMEGILLEDKSIITGYFYLYNDLRAFIFDNNNDEVIHHLDAINIISDCSNEKLNFSGEINSNNYIMYDAKMDEFCYVHEKNKKATNLQIKLIEDENTIKDIEYLIRNNIKNLSDIYKYYYNDLKKHRYGNLKELIDDLKFYNEHEQDKLLDVIEDLKVYLKTLEQSKEETNQIKKGKQKTKKRKNR